MTADGSKLPFTLALGADHCGLVLTGRSSFPEDVNSIAGLLSELPLLAIVSAPDLHHVSRSARGVSPRS
jgi:hypothetical protein